jgi:hypothetical protein
VVDFFIWIKIKVITDNYIVKKRKPEQPRDPVVRVGPQPEPKKPMEIPKPIGLGDRVERIAQPIARVIDKVAGTNIQGCGACQKRKEYLNKKFPET